MRNPHELLLDARLYVLVDGRDSLDGLRRLVQSLVTAGVDVLQLRDKQLCDRDLVERARLMRRWTVDTATMFIVNDRPDIAVLSAADGVHVGQEELSVADCRRVLGPHQVVGLSTHDVVQARQAITDGADYIGCGPTFASRTKTFRDFAGLDFLRAVQREIAIPAFAIGGICRVNVAQVLDTGFRRIAVSAAVTEADDPAAAAASLRKMLFQAG